MVCIHFFCTSVVFGQADLASFESITNNTPYRSHGMSVVIRGNATLQLTFHFRGWGGGRKQHTTLLWAGKRGEISNSSCCEHAILGLLNQKWFPEKRRHGEGCKRTSWDRDGGDLRGLIERERNPLPPSPTEKVADIMEA